jgi:hypothetical protein
MTGRNGARPTSVIRQGLSDVTVEIFGRALLSPCARVHGGGEVIAVGLYRRTAAGVGVAIPVKSIWWAVRRPSFRGN